MRQRAHWPGLGWSGSLQVGQSSQAAGAVQSAQSGSVRVPETIAERRPHAEQAADRRWQAGHQGRPVAREIPQGVFSPQIEQVSGGSVGQPGAQRSVRSSPVDWPAAAAVDAGLQVRRVGDEAVRAQRPASVVAGDRFAAGSAARALLDAGVGDAGAADPHPVQGLVDAHDPVTAGAGRPDDPGDAGRMQQVDEPRDRAQRCEMAVPGQQRGSGFQCPGQFLLVGGPRCRAADGGGDGLPVGFAGPVRRSGRGSP